MLCTKTGNKIFKILCTGNGPEIEIFVHLGDIFMIYNVKKHPKILVLILHFLYAWYQPARMVGGRVVSYGDC